MTAVHGVLEWAPELRFTPLGKAVCTLTIRTDSGDQVNCNAWEALAETIAENFDLGSPITVTGYFKTRKWTDSDGKEQSRRELTVKTVAKESGKESMTTTDITPYVPGAMDWDELSASADEVLGHELISGEAADKLIGVPFIIHRVVFREGVQRKGAPYRDDYVSCEAVVAPEHVIKERANRGRLDLSAISVDPGEHIVFNDGSTGIYRQIVQYLSAKDLIRLPAGPDAGAKGESIFDLPRSEWDDGDETAATGINIRLKCPRGLRYSEYTNEFTQDGKTRYIA